LGLTAHMRHYTSNRALVQCARGGGGESCEFALLLYKKMKNGFESTVAYDEKYHIFDKVCSGGSTIFMCSHKEYFVLRMDAVPSDGGVNLHICLPLQNHTKYVSVIGKILEYIKR